MNRSGSSGRQGIAVEHEAENEPRPSAPRLLFVSPDLRGLPTGGTLYNRHLLAALSNEPIQVHHCQLQAVPEAMALSRSDIDQVWVDSLYLSAVDDLREHLPPQLRLGIVLHYLPSLLLRPELRKPSELSEVERRALSRADYALTTSEFMHGLLGQLCPALRCACVMPGVAALQPEPHAPHALRDGTALMVCNITENKGVLPFLRELAAASTPADDFVVAIAGSLELEREYAQACRRTVERHPWLARHVLWLGELTGAQVVSRMSRASVCVSASVMESYGMVLAEARALGTPIVAVKGGNVAYHVDAESGGSLVPDHRALAHALFSLMRTPGELQARQRLAGAAVRRRSWQLAAREFVQAVTAV